MRKLVIDKAGAQATVARFSARALRARPVSTEEMVHTTPRSTSCSSSSRSVLPNVALEGIYTQLHSIKLNDPETGHQLDQFHQVLDAIHDAGFETGIVHAAGSFTLLHNSNARLDGVRAGSAGAGRPPGRCAFWRAATGPAWPRSRSPGAG